MGTLHDTGRRVDPEKLAQEEGQVDTGNPELVFGERRNPFIYRTTDDNNSSTFYQIARGPTFLHAITLHIISATGARIGIALYDNNQGVAANTVLSINNATELIHNSILDVQLTSGMVLEVVSVGVGNIIRVTLSFR